MPDADAPSSWIERALHQRPAVHVEATIDGCGTVTIAATPRRRGRAVVVSVGDEILVGGVGAQTWTGPVPLKRGPGDTLTIRASGRSWGRPTAAEVGLRPADALVAALAVGPVGGSYVPVDVRATLGSGCVGTPVGWSLFADHGALASGEGTVDYGQTASWTFTPWEGPHTISGRAVWRGWTVPFPPASIDVPLLPVDADRDGALADVDCDDADPFSRPGMPDVPGDGRDNDCDGRLAGDRDGDGYDADRPRPKRLDPAQRAALATIAPDGFEATLLAAPRLGEADCADGDAARHPWALERADGADDDCDGRTTFDLPATLGEPDPTDPGATFATASWLGAGRTATIVGLPAGDTDVLAFRQPGVTSALALALTVHTDAPVWVELWRGGPVRDPAAPVMGPRPSPTPVLRQRVTPDRPLVLPPPPPPPPPAPPKARKAAAPTAEKGTWTGALWRGVTSMFDGDGQIDGGEVLLSWGAALFVTPITGLMDLADWQAAQEGAAAAGGAAAAAGAPTPPDPTIPVGDGELLYVVLRAAPGGAGARARLAVGPP